MAVHVAGARSVEAAADTLRPDIVLPSAVRWIRRRLTVVRTALVIAAGLLPDLLLGDVSLVTLGTAWGTTRVLVTLRSHVADHLAIVPPPLGFGQRPTCRPPRSPASQHAIGADRSGPSG